MSIRNTAENYGTIAKFLHWLTAALFLGAYMTYYYRHWFTEERSAEGLTALQIHASIGVSVFVIVILRLLWRFMNRTPDEAPGTKLAHLAAKLGHLALYAIMIIMPITGYMGFGGSTNYFFLFEIPRFADTQLFEVLVTNGLGMTFEDFEKPMDFIHKDIMGAWLVWILILGHAGAALYHHYVLQDRTLKKMTSGK
ncbi:cytochrome b [Leucothrix sargassi]|nr:cytochrome b [Leucothrix sargassi]